MPPEARGLRPRRRATLLDGMIVIAATALGFALVRAVFPPGPVWPQGGPDVLWFFQGPPTVLVVTTASALVALRLRQPRPPLRRLVSQPGFVACAGTVVAMGLGLAGFLGFLAVHTAPSTRANFSGTPAAYWDHALKGAPEFVLGVWLALRAAGRWSPERSWIDRAGRAVGYYWITGLAYMVVRPALGRFFDWA